MGELRAVFLHFHSDDNGAAVHTLSASGITATVIDRANTDAFLQSLFALIDAYDAEPVTSNES